MKYFLVDAFTTEPFGGNPAGVMLLDGDFPREETCVKIARELRYSETAFVRRLDGQTFHIRYFTPAAEVGLCGHATIGTFAALRQRGVIDDGEYRLRVVSGELGVSVRGDSVIMDMAAPRALARIEREDDLTELYRVMGLSFAEERSRGLSLLPQIVSTGLPDILLPVSSCGALEGIAPDFAALSALSERRGIVGVHAFTLDGGDATCHVRNFAPLYGIDEESATGTANGALTYYGCLNGFIAEGADCRFVQGEKMGRPSVILTRIERSGGDLAVRVGGSGIVLAAGEFYAE